MRKQQKAGVVAVMMALVGLAQGGFAQTTTPTAGPTNSASPTNRTVTFAGVSFSVPSTWPVYDLHADPSRCVRFDVPAVYLGHTGPDPRCPSHLVGRADGLQIEAADAVTATQVAAATAATTIDGAPVMVDPGAWTGGQERVLVPGRAVIATMTRSPKVSVADQVLSSLRVAPDPGRPSPAPGAAAALPGAVQSPPAATVAPAAALVAPTAGAEAAAVAAASPAGEGFDACSAPSEATMSAWLSSPYRSLGIYIGGGLRACTQANLTPQWITHVARQGWLLVPTYVGLQAPCNSGLFGSLVINPQQAANQGGFGADDAVNAAAALGLGVGTPIYFDMEGYDPTVPGCSQAVVSFLEGWTNELHARGYVSGVYGSSASTITDLVKQYTNPAYRSPDDVWFASWSCCPHSVTGDSHIPAADWSPHRRLHQYLGGHDETYAGVTINIDSDYNDGALAWPPNSTYMPLSPARVLDTRNGTGRVGGPISAGSWIDFPVTGVGGVPGSGVSAVVLNTTATGATANSFLTVFPAGSARPLASNLNVGAGQDVSNLVVAPVGFNGKVSIYNDLGTVDVVADVQGWYADATSQSVGSTYLPASPARVLDTRNGTGGVTGSIPGGATIDLAVAGVGGVPGTGVSAVVLNTTATGATANSYLTVFPTGGARPLASNLNVDAGQDVANLVVAQVGANGHVSIYNNQGSVNVVADIQGWFADPTSQTVGSTYVPAPPARVLDTRNGTGGVAAPIPAGSTIGVSLAGVGGVPASGVSAVVLNTTATGATRSSFLTVFPSGGARPLASNLNFGAGQNVPNLVVARVGANGEVSIYNNQGTVNVVADVEGWYVSPG